jgi:hypothetical protein
MASVEDIKNASIDVFLLLNDIVEKTNKFHTDDIDRFAVSAVTSKRVPPLVKKIYDLEEAIGRFRSEVRRVVMLNAKGCAEATVVSDDPTDTATTATAAAPKPELPTIVAPTVNAVASIAEAKPAPESDSTADAVAVAEKEKKTKKADKKSVAGKADDKPSVVEAATDDQKSATTKAKKDKAATTKAVAATPTVSEELPVAPPKEVPAESPARAPSPTNSVGEGAAQPKKGVRTKKAVAETVAVPAQAAAAPVTTTAAGITDASTTAETEDDSKAPIHARRKKIPKAVRILVWNLHVGSHKGEDRCMCCKEKKIDVANFHCGHVLAEAKGGDLTIKNLRPICSACNSAMGTRSMNEFTKEFFGWEI